MAGRQFKSEFKARVALEAIKGRRTGAEISCMYEVHASQIAKWKKKALSGLKDVFSNVHKKDQESLEVRIENLYGQIGKLQVENNFLKKNIYRN